ncbi:hypothetical protein [Halosimplex pelagicum]|uniref:Metal-dependent hydrolase n=1 Tax=Halosimplex pelagicum TaxID=869886 RepID=A0A7D5PAY6_9EURY|nr:hypothetical protein [Halosimplex pelagicum]QLH81358.1 hypothetical protein HZS54_06845 [Halosimplex pelagicum]
MSIALAHFAFGAGMTTLLVTFLLPTVWYPRTAILVGGGWAMVPDFHWVSPIAKQQLHRIHQTSPVTDVFWFHRVWDRIDPTDSKTVAAVLVAFLIVSTAIAEWRQYRSPEAVRVAYDSYLDPESSD